MTTNHRPVWLSALVLLSAIDAIAQPEQTRITIGGGALFAEPKEEFRTNVGNGWGGGGGVKYHLDREGWFGLRFDAAGFAYGHEEKRVPFSETVGGRVLVDVNTTNSLASIAFGPEFELPRGPVRPYLNFAASRLFFWTTSSVEGIRNNNGEIVSTKNHSDGTGAWVYGTGLRIPIKRAPSILLDFGIRYYRGGEASYLREGSIQDNPDGSITLTPLLSRTPFLVYSVGVRLRIPYKSTNPCPRLLC
jgi:hypothetical protein